MTGQPFRIVEFPRSRLATIDVGRMTARRHLMFAFLEIDVTGVREVVRRMRREGGQVSFTSWMIKAIGSAVERNKSVHALQRGKRQLLLFDGVDVAIPVERFVDGRAVPLALRIEGVNGKSVEAIEGELRAAQNQVIGSEHDYVLNENRMSRLSMKLFYRLPQFLRVFMFKRLFSNPFRAKTLAGTVAITTVNAVGRVSGWIMPTRPMHNLLIAFGSINKKPWVVKNEIAVREILHLTVAFNHDVIDGMPARSFIDDLVKHVEHGRIG